MSSYDDIAFTGPVRAMQTRYGSRAFYARRAARVTPDEQAPVSEDVTEFLTGVDGFFLASVSDDGWPYVQFRGGPPGFLHVMDTGRVGWADFRGNLQYISVGNISADDRVALIAIDYPSRQRVKIFGHARTVFADDEPELVASLTPPDYEAVVERAVIVTVAALDWNCRQHITPRWTAAELEPQLAALRDQVRAAQAENKQLRRLLEARPQP